VCCGWVFGSVAFDVDSVNNRERRLAFKIVGLQKGAEGIPSIVIQNLTHTLVINGI
jgi:hypothetical protein